MSSARFEVELVPDRRIRRGLIGVAGAAMLTGSLLILDMRLEPAVKAAFAGLWLVAGVLEVRDMLRGMCRLYRIRISPDGDVRAVSADGGVEGVQLLSGSVVLARVAWLRIRFADGSRYGELLTGEASRCEQWRGLQLVWKQRSSIFGRPEGS